MQEITISLTEPELQALSGLIDAGVRATGLGAVKSAAALLAKLEVAVAEARQQTGSHTDEPGRLRAVSG